MSKTRKTVFRDVMDNLPAEIIELIVRQDPASLANLSLTCRSMNAKLQAIIHYFADIRERHIQLLESVRPEKVFNRLRNTGKWFIDASIKILRGRLPSASAPPALMRDHVALQYKLMEMVSLTPFESRARKNYMFCVIFGVTVGCLCIGPNFTPSRRRYLDTGIQKIDTELSQFPLRYRRALMVIRQILVEWVEANASTVGS
jgi:hypothetical protein